MERWRPKPQLKGASLGLTLLLPVLFTVGRSLLGIIRSATRREDDDDDDGSGGHGAVLKDLEFCKRLPKVELHAHLSGSVRDTTLLELMRQSGKGEKELEIMRVEINEKRTLSQCFKIFALIHQLIRTHQQITRITVEVLSDFAADGVRYVELRTTPREDKAYDMTLESYVQAVLKGFEIIEDLGVDIMPRLLLSINRAQSVEKAENTARLAIDYLKRKNKYFAGVDFSGNPYAGDFQRFKQIFLRLRKHGVPCAIHCAEIKGHDEVDAILEFGPERLGHAVVLTAKNRQKLRRLRTPVEICPTSNMRTLHLRCIEEHPTIGDWLSVSHPFCICTDDSGVFRTTLSNELKILMQGFRLSKEKMAQLALQASTMTFLPPAEAKSLQKRMEIETEQVLKEFSDTKLRN